MFLKKTIPNLGKAINDLTIDALSITSTTIEEGAIDGRILKCDTKHIYIKIIEGFDMLSMANTNSAKFDIDFRINRTTYQLQLQALDYVSRHQLFEILINNPLYSKTVDENSSQIQTEFM